MLDAMGDRPVCVLRGHGLTAIGASVEQAIVRALAVDDLARMLVRVAQLGAVPTPLPAEDLSELPDLGSGFNEDLIWRHHEQRLRDAGLHPAGDVEASRP
jgi:ribulose-5-phosphate 4-epimerase/fuculose-1-phosphate aldolase